MKNNDKHLRLFVYGTLKKGFWNFDRFCTRAVSIEPATTWGRLYHLPAGFPALEVPEDSILATGTADPLADTRTQNTIELPEYGMTRPEGDWDLVHGELTFYASLSCFARKPASAIHGSGVRRENDSQDRFLIRLSLRQSRLRPANHRSAGGI